MLFDDILVHLGDFDRYQRRIVFLICLLAIPVSWQVLAHVFTSADVDHWCAVAEWEAENCSTWNFTKRQCKEAKRHASIPALSVSSSGQVTYSRCQRYNVSGIDFNPGVEIGNITTVTIDCDHGWVYDTAQYQSTIITEFNLVCDETNVGNYAQLVSVAGFLCGSFFLGSLADWIGRKKTLLLCLVMQATAGIILATSPTFWFFAVFRFFLGFATIGVYLIGFVLAIEYVGPSRRIITGALIPGAFAIGYMILALLALLIRQWWCLQLVISVPILGLLPLVVILPESARWLMSRGEYRLAGLVIKKATNVNNVKLPENLFLEEKTAFEELESVDPGAAHKRTSFLDLFRTPNMRIKTMNIMFIWFVNGLVYHGLSLRITSSLGVTDYAAFYIVGSIEIPSYILMLFVAGKLGRRRTLTYSMVIGGFVCLISIFLPSGAPGLTFAMIGQFCDALSFALIYLFSSELFPTRVRCVGMGISSAAGSLGAMFSPYLLALDVWKPLPLFVFGLLEILAGALTLLLPETSGKNLPDTLDEGEQFGRKRINAFFGRFSPLKSSKGLKPKQTSLWTKNPGYEKVTADNQDTKTKKELGSLWARKPEHDEIFNNDKETDSGENNEHESIEHVECDGGADETVEMELSTFKKDADVSNKQLDSESDAELAIFSRDEALDMDKSDDSNQITNVQNEDETNK